METWIFSMASVILTVLVQLISLSYRSGKDSAVLQAVQSSLTTIQSRLDRVEQHGQTREVLPARIENMEHTLDNISRELKEMSLRQQSVEKDVAVLRVSRHS